MPFIELDITTDATTLADAAIERLADIWGDGWDPKDADLEIIHIETLASMASDVASAAALVPDAIFREYGSTLVGLPYLGGSPAVGEAVITAADSTGYSSDFLEFALEGVGFVTDAPVTIPAGQSQVTVPFTATEPGVLGNGLQGTADPLIALSWLESITVGAATDGGVDPETDEDYQNRLSDRLQLQATTLVTGRDFELMATSSGLAIARAIAIVGQARQVTVAVADEAGEPIVQSIKDELAALYQDYRQVNTLYSVIDPTYTTINVTYTVVALPDQAPTELKERCDAAVTEWLSPANWGRPRPAAEIETQTWLLETVVRYSELITRLSVDGVRYVQAATLNGGTVDINLTGTVPLTRPGTITGTVT